MKRLLKLALFIAVIVGIAKFLEAKKAEWTGLTEAQIRDKLHSLLSTRMPADKLEEVQSQVVKAMREKGMVAAEPAEAAPADETGTTDS